MVNFGNLELLVRYCRKKPPEEPPEIFAFIQIFEKSIDSFAENTQPKIVFSGWMFASSPALNSLEHRAYDVWVIDCKI